MKQDVNIRLLNLNETLPASLYQSFEGDYVDAMPALMADNRTAMSIPDLMKRRLQVLESGNKALIEAWWGNYFDSATGIAYCNGQVKVVHNAQPLLDINRNSKLSWGALVLTEKQFEELEGKTSQVVVWNILQLKENVLKHPLWRMVVDDEKLLQQYANAHFRKYGEGAEPKVWLSSTQDQPTVRPLVLGSGDNRFWSGLGSGEVSGFIARLVGVRRDLEAKVAKK